MEFLEKIKLKNIKLNDSFFDSLKEDYCIESFENWFNKKAADDLEAYVKFDDHKNIKAFLMLQLKNKNKRRIKISTMKIDESKKMQRLSERMIYIIFSEMEKNNINESYITLFKEKQKELYEVLSSWGFIETGTKGDEIVMTKFRDKKMDTVKKNYKWYFDENILDLYKEKSNFYFICLDCSYHDKLLPNNKLSNVANQSKEFNVSSTSISKTYITKMEYNKPPKKWRFYIRI
ncbi:MAG: hypothetical protein ACRC8C_03025 [Mycoplasmoidaceae bacterium]